MSPQTSPIDFDAALQNPTGFFAQPQDVTDHSKLSREQKLAILQRWEHDALRLSESEAEGMGGGEDSMLGRVKNAMLQLRGEDR
jgi:hypothetical protein